MINVAGISKNFGDVRAVDNVTFSVNDGEITGLLGPNGAGKTTTLRMLTCYLKPDSGEITVGNLKTDESPREVKQLIGYLPESAPLYSDMLVYDYLNYVSDIRGVEDKKRIREMGDLCGINDVMHKNIGELSKGYKQRVGLAYSMIHDPDILVLDEPTSGLDPNQIIEIRNLIKEIGKKKTVILSTHILSEVEATCDRIIIINKGNIVADDKKDNLQAGRSGNNSLAIKVTGTDFATLSGELTGISGVNRVDQRPDDRFTSAAIVYSGENDIRPDVFRLVSSREWIMYEMKQEHRSLENVFRELTRGGENGEV
jgi:ABC-2 type transport system ATP-binding protein